MIPPLSFDEFQTHAKNEKYVAVFHEIPAGQLTPVLIYTLLKKEYKAEGVMLENLRPGESPRYSYIGFNPLSTFSMHYDDNRHPLIALRDFQSQFSCSTRPEVADLITSAAGFFTYDAVRYFEVVSDRHAKDSSLPSILFNFYALSLAFDHEKQTILISLLVEVGAQLEQVYNQAQKKLKSIIKILSEGDPEQAGLSRPSKSAEPATTAIEVDVSDADFFRMVEKAKDYIIGGDAFQIVLSRCFKRRYSVSPLAIYQTLRQVSPSPFMFYFPTESGVMMGASPERLIHVQNKQITVSPIAGTRQRTGDIADEMIASDLLSDKKEVAEHMMLVDLARNDVGAVSDPGSVRLNELLHVKHYSHVSHITSTITGKLQEKFDAFDAFASVFPAGTLSGAPKIRAMNIIDALETSRRGLYGGAICRLDVSGNLDSCIAIRMATLQNGIATIRTGAGIVYDSNPVNEVQETYQKAQAMLDAIAKAHGE